MSRAGRGSREPGPRSAWWRVGWERRPSGRHRGPQRREIAHRQPRRSAGTAWSAGLRPASRGSAKPAPMTPGSQRESRTTSCRGRGTDRPDHLPVRAQPPALHTRTAFATPSRNACCQRRKSLERRSPTGIARERETCTNDAGCQRSKSARTAWNADLWPVLPVGAGRPAPRPGGPRDRASPTAKKRGDGLERRSPTGIARERETCTNDAGCQRSKSARTAWNAGPLASSPGGGRQTGTAARRAARSRIANREEARGRLGAPVSDRHRAGARNLHQ